MAELKEPCSPHTRETEREKDEDQDEEEASGQELERALE